MLGVTHPGGGVEIFLVTSWYRNRDKLLPDGPIGTYADFASMTENRSSKNFAPWDKSPLCL